MTPRERTLKVLRGEVPDRVPVMPGYGTWYASRIYGGDLFDLEEGRFSASELMAGVTRKYGCEVWYWVGYGDDIQETRADGIGQAESARETIDSDSYVETVRLRSPSGDLTSRTLHSRWNPPHPITGLIKDLERDWPVYQTYRGDDWQWGNTTSLADVPPDDLSLGITSFVILLPVDFWKGLRCDTQAALLDMIDGAPAMDEALEWHKCYCLQKLQARLDIEPMPDMIHLQGSSSSLSMISPDIYRRLNLDFVNAVCALSHSKSVPVQLHHCGRSAGLVEMLYECTDVDIIHPLEPPPGGDIDLKKIKKRFGDRLVLMGNLNTFQLMLNGTPAQVKAAARQCIDNAAEGGRFILTTGDQLGRDTPEGNVIAMVEAAHEFGSY